MRDALLLGLLSLTGCVATRYAPTAGMLPPMVYPGDEVRADLLRRGVTVSRPAGHPQPVEPLSDAEAWAVFSVSRRRYRGEEHDLFVPSPQGLEPVTCWVDQARSITVASGPTWVWPEEPDAAQLWAEILGQGVVQGLAEEDGRRWAPWELQLVADALRRLSAAERATLVDIELVRSGVSPRRPQTELAWFDPLTTPPSIRFFDLAFADRDGGFVGPPEAPSPHPLMTLLHEIGHALADWPWRYGGPTPLDRKGPVIQAYLAAAGGRLRPTTFSTDPHESFAEAFALHHSDPAALRRVSPAVAAWFSAEGHVQALPVGRSRVTTLLHPP